MKALHFSFTRDLSLHENNTPAPAAAYTPQAVATIATAGTCKCRVCKRPLKTAKYVAAGVGPVCAKKSAHTCDCKTQLDIFVPEKPAEHVPNLTKLQQIEVMVSDQTKIVKDIFTRWQAAVKLGQDSAKLEKDFDDATDELQILVLELDKAADKLGETWTTVEDRSKMGLDY